MASGVILGNCPVCDELVWEDDWEIIDNTFIHEGCRKSYIKMKYGMNEEQFLRLCGASVLRKEIMETIQSLKETTGFYMEKLLTLQERLAVIEGRQKEDDDCGCKQKDGGGE